MAEVVATYVWILTQWDHVMGVYDNESAAAVDADRLGGKERGYAVEKWLVDSDPVASRKGP